MALILVFFSGLAALVYQVLWMKQLGLLFGNTAHAAAVTLAAFFAGLAAGSWLWGRRCTAIANPLRTYARLEVGIALTACAYFLILRGYYALYPYLFDHIDQPLLILTVKFLLALLLVFPPAFFMGGTIPVMGQFLIDGSASSDRRPRRAFGSTAAVLYAFNTLGAATGALLAGFFLPIMLGYRLTCLAAIAITSLTALFAWLLSHRPASSPAAIIASNPSRPADSSQPPPPQPGQTWQRLALAGVCFLSGLGFLALEVLWTHMFMQVLDNSVYTFAAILVVVLICLAIGAMLSALLARFTQSPMPLLALLLILGGLAVAITPNLFMHLTDGLQILAIKDTWANYILLIFRKVFLAIGLPALLLGMIFPFLMKSEERFMQSAGLSLGRLGAINTIGAILGSLLCGFVLLELLRMWHAMQLLAALYFLAALALPLALRRSAIALRLAAIASLVLLLFPLNPADLPLISTDPHRQANEKIIQTWQGSHGTIAVADGPNGLVIKVNSHYGLGATGAYIPQRMQNDVTLFAFPKTQSIFFLGMGTGITAGAALDPQFNHVNRIVVCELIPQVITAAKQYITNVNGHDLTNGLFSDPRATVLAQDGRQFLLASRQQFDMINADLFVPFQAGTGSLYSKEHFQTIKDRLHPNGVFFQWIPLYQVTEDEFKIIARTMLEVFDQVSLWRSGFQPGDDIVALAGHANAGPLPPATVDDRQLMRASLADATANDLMNLALPLNSQTILLFYCGNVTASRALFDDYPVNTDDKPVIEYMAPRNYRKLSDSPFPWYIGPRLAQLVAAMHKLCPPDRDPFLARRSAADRRLPLAGAHFYEARLWQVIGDPARTLAAWQQFVAHWSNLAPNER